MMSLLRRIPVRYFHWIPALYFAAIGAMDIVSDILAHKLTTFNFFFNLALFAPLLPFRIVWKVCGLIACLFAIYGSFALLVFLSKHLNGQPMRYPFDTFVIGPIFIIITLLAGLSLIYAARASARSTAELKKQ